MHISSQAAVNIVDNVPNYETSGSVLFGRVITNSSISHVVITFHVRQCKSVENIVIIFPLLLKLLMEIWIWFGVRYPVFAYIFTDFYNACDPDSSLCFILTSIYILFYLLF